MCKKLPKEGARGENHHCFVIRLFPDSPNNALQCESTEEFTSPSAPAPGLSFTRLELSHKKQKSLSFTGTQVKKATA